MNSDLYKTLILATALFCCNAAANGNALHIKVQDQATSPLANAVIELITEQPIPLRNQTQISIAQQGLMFVPFVTAAPINSAIEFPNKDKTRHHIYSFSDAKTFEIQLYADTPEQPVIFDRQGIVVLGCNIHDYMQAYIYIGASPLLAVTDGAGTAVFSDLPAGNYQLKLWHPWQKQPQQITSITLTTNTEQQLTLPVEQKALPTAPKRGFGH